jgi:hypothetical protein
VLDRILSTSAAQRGQSRRKCLAVGADNRGMVTANAVKRLMGNFWQTEKHEHGEAALSKKTKQTLCPNAVELAESVLYVNCARSKEETDPVANGVQRGNLLRISLEKRRESGAAAFGTE